MITKKSSYVLSVVLFLVSTITPVSAADRIAPSSIARLSFTRGITSFLPAGETKWVKTSINRPIITGDRLWTGANSLLELQLDTATIRLGNQTNIKVLNLNNKIIQVQLSGGTILLRVGRLKPQQIVEVSTPNLAFITAKPGNYRIFVNSKTNITYVTVKEGSGTVYGSKTAYQINAGSSCPFGKNLKIYQCTTKLSIDDFDRWSQERDRLGKVKTTRYVSSDMIGEEDLQQYGRWTVAKKYGHVWIPNETRSDWAPYRNGHWVWIRHWGWTWVDEQPWGFAPFHYGRWVYIDHRWSWVPGPRNIQPVYAPALVVFVGGKNFNLKLSSGVSGIAWFPLAPGEVYIPPRHFSREYFIDVNRSNTQISNTYIINSYTNQTNITYQNINVVNGITAVSTQAFQQSQPVNRALVQVPSQTINQAPKNPIATVVPDTASVLGTSEVAQSQPPADLLDKPVVVTTPPPPAPAPIAEEQKLLEKDPGTPLATQETDQLKPTKKNEETEVNIVNPEQTTVPISKELIEQSPPEPEVPPEPQAQPEPEVQPEPQAEPEPEVQPEPQEQPEDQQ